MDYIAGTSMGGLVGGMYATGMEPAKMRAEIGRLDWNRLLAADPQFQDLSFRRKEDRRVLPNFIEVGWKKGLRLQEVTIWVWIHSNHPASG